MAWRFNPPDNWPVPRTGEPPPEGWQPDPAWGPAPDDWSFWIWVDDPSVGTTAATKADDSPPAIEPPSPVEPVPPPTSSASSNGDGGPEERPHDGGAIDEGAARPDQPRDRRRMPFGRAKALSRELDELHAWADRVGVMDLLELERERTQLRVVLADEQERCRREQQDMAKAAQAEQARLTKAVHGQQVELEQHQAQVQRVRQELGELRAQVVATSDEALLQEVGIYDFHHRLDDAVAYKNRLADLKQAIKAAARGGHAVTAATDWTVNGSKQQGQRMVRDISKLLLRAYNAEADQCVRVVRPHSRDSVVKRLHQTVRTIERLGKTMHIHIDEEYHQLRIHEVLLTADYLAQKEEEKERQREERERLREERAAMKEIERERGRLDKERSHHETVLERLRAIGDEDGAATIEAKLAEVEAAARDIEARAANRRAGYVYVISNRGAFGERMVKIGMTRRLEPNDRVRELGDASVPFRFDTHALIFSQDAVELEGRLHAALADRRVNRVNLRREFFYATPTEVREELEAIGDQHLLEFIDHAEALEWRASGRGTTDPESPESADRDFGVEGAVDGPTSDIAAVPDDDQLVGFGE